MKLQGSFLWILLPVANFFVWYFYGVAQRADQVASICGDKMKELLDESLHALRAASDSECEKITSEQCSHKVNPIHKEAQVKLVNSVEFDKYRSSYMAENDVVGIPTLYSPTLDTLVFQPDKTPCQSFKHEFLPGHGYTCMAVVYIKDTNAAYNIIRFNDDIDFNGIKISNPDPSQIDKYSAKEQGIEVNDQNAGKLWPAGYFRKVPKDRGRDRTKEKLGPFLDKFVSITEQLDMRLADHNLKKGDDAVVMVVNEGEIDLFLNFACSCRLHNITLSNIIVFAGSPEVVPLIEATGAIGLFHVGYATVSKKPSVDYLDRVFVDMMWYKAFSIYLVLRKGINVLFQDIDLVWFKDPMPYFHEYIRKHKARSDMTGSYIEAFFTDDGQRSMRYTPFYANSGFYYFVASERSEYFAYSIMIAFDAVQVLGSHQNVFTTKLVEGLSLTHRHTKILPLRDFPNGIMYHHDKAYMKKLKQKEVSPFHFHMCWTQGKPDKLKNLRTAAMWYLHQQCSNLDELIADKSLSRFETDGQWMNSLRSRQHRAEPGVMYSHIYRHRNFPQEQQWNMLGGTCCQMGHGSI